jgi:hypothetical protein
MTAWHEDLTDSDSMIAYIRSGGQGGTDNQLIIVIGSRPYAGAFADTLRKRP